MEDSDGSISVLPDSLCLTDSTHRMSEMSLSEHDHGVNSMDSGITCAICLDVISWREFSQVKGCDHTFCVTCILCWASYKEIPWCPQCRTPFSMLYLFRTLDGSQSEYLAEESVCLLLCATWFKRSTAVQNLHGKVVYGLAEPVSFYAEDEDEEYGEEEEEEDDDVRYLPHIGNRWWGVSGCAGAGRMAARPNSTGGHSSSSSRSPVVSQGLGRRARRAQERREASYGLAKPVSSYTQDEDEEYDEEEEGDNVRYLPHIGNSTGRMVVRPNSAGGHSSSSSRSPVASRGLGRRARRAQERRDASYSGH